MNWGTWGQTIVRWPGAHCSDIKGTGAKPENADCIILLERTPDRNLPRDPALIRELRGLERKSGRGQDIIDHAPGQHDDYANSVAIAVVQAIKGNGRGRSGDQKQRRILYDGISRNAPSGAALASRRVR